MTMSATSSRRLAVARAVNRPGSEVPHTVVVLPSYSVAPSLFSQYRDRLLALEHRQLVHLLALARVPGARMVFVTSQQPAADVLSYYLSLVPEEQSANLAHRLEIADVAADTPRSVSASLLERPDLLARIRQLARGGPALIEPWIVTATEAAVARRLGMPLNGTAPELWRLGFKSKGRRLMRRAGLPLPLGMEDVCSVDGVVTAVEFIRAMHPDAVGVVVKTDDSGAAVGNRVLLLSELRRSTQVRAAVEALEPWFLADLSRGAVVEELLVGNESAHPSVQLDIGPGGRVEVLSTHEQLLGGANAQVFAGCRFPADPAYAPELARYAESIGDQLAERGSLGRVSVDFVATHGASGEWRLHALEINLRKGGTSHPYSLLQNLTDGYYDRDVAAWRAADGSRRCYRSTDNLANPALTGRSAGEVIGALSAAGLHFDRMTRTGVVLHSLCALDVDGGIGLTAIGGSAKHAEELYQAAVTRLLDALGAPACPPRLKPTAATASSIRHPNGWYRERTANG
jgi:hypothetical protein